MKTSIVTLIAAASPLIGAPIPLVNPSGEINGGASPATISAAVLGWDSDGGQVIRNGTDYGNGAWRFSFEDSREIRQMTAHRVEAGASYSLRFDAAMFATGSAGVSQALIGGALRNGDFNADISATDSRNFSNTPDWTNLGGAQTTEATRLDLPTDGTRNAILTDNGSRVFANDTGHTLAAGELFRATYRWRDAFGWNDATDKIGVTLFTTVDNTVTGTRTVIQTLLSGISAADSAYQSETANFGAILPAANGKRLFVSFEGVDGDSDLSGFARLDNFNLARVESHDPEDPASRVIIADLYVDNNGTPLPLATRSYLFKSTTVGSWDHYHLAVPPGALDAHAGKTLGVRFRSDDSASGNFQSVDNIRLDTWPASVPDGSFSENWNTSPNQVWIGSGYWANRLHDWQVNNGRVNCIQSARERRTIHRTGTSIRGNGGGFTLSVRTGVHAGTNGNNARTGFLLGSAPNLDWRGALLVHDSLGRDFGLFLGLRGDGTAVIEDYSTGAVSGLAAGTAAGFTGNSRLVLTATYLPASGNYSLKIEARNSSDVLLSTATATVPSDRVLGSFGLLSHAHTNADTSTRFWFDDFTGSGAALHPEPDRQLAILGAMHTLSRGTLKLTAQLPPLSLTGNPQVFLDVKAGESWQQIAAAPVDNTDGVSSYTATFKIPNWNDRADSEYRVRVNILGTNHTLTGTIRRDPVDRNEIVVATTTCQRLSDVGLETGSVDWTPVVIWHPHILAYSHLAKHRPDVHFAAGDQIYEGLPTPPDNTSDFNRHHDYLYKWYLWLMEAGDLARDTPTIALPDDHDVFQGNLWGEGGVATASEDAGGYRWPASFVKMVERTQTSNLPDPDPYNAVQPPPSVAQGIGVYFTGLVYGRVGIAVLEDRKFKTGRQNPPASLDNQHLLGERQHNFLRGWNTDWAGQDIKLLASQSPLGNLRTHASTGYSYSLNDQDTHGWPVHRRNEAWDLLRASRMFQIAGDQHLGSVAHHGVESPRDAGYSFTAPAISNFFPRSWDPVHNASGLASTVSPYKGDFFFDGKGTLPDGVTPNRTANDPAHFAVLAAANSAEYYGQTLGMSPANLHDRSPGYGITRINRATRRITFEAWPLYADPEFPQTGAPYADWPITISQTDNEGRVPTGYLRNIDTQSECDAVIRVFDESDNSLVYAMRVRGNLFRPPVYDNSSTYRIEIAYGDGAVTETHPSLVPSAIGAPGIRSFTCLRPSIAEGGSSLLRWDVVGAATLTIDQGIGDVKVHTVDGIGFLEVSPALDTTYTLSLNGAATATTTVRVFLGKAAWYAARFSASELSDPLVSGAGADPDGDGFSNDEEYRFQTDPRNSSSRPVLSGRIVNLGGALRADFSSSYPLDTTGCTLFVESSPDLRVWTRLPSNSFTETARDNMPSSGTSRITIRLNNTLPGNDPNLFYRAGWDFGQ